jgi:hypothetical protein
MADKGVAPDYMDRAFRSVDEARADLPASVQVRRREAALRERRQAMKDLRALQAQRPLKPPT